MDIEALEKAYKQSPDSTTFLMVVARILKDEENYAKAWKYLDSAKIETFEDTANAVLAGNVALFSGQPQQAILFCHEPTAERSYYSGQSLS